MRLSIATVISGDDYGEIKVVSSNVIGTLNMSQSFYLHNDIGFTGVGQIQERFNALAREIAEEYGA